MAELNLKQTIDRLNAEFTGETRKLVFWYNDKTDFVEDMETVELQDAKIYRLQPGNQFYMKYFLECIDQTTNYPIYAPFPKPDVRDNHLEDTCAYSRRFLADRVLLLSLDLGIEEKYKSMIEKHIKFFVNKERTQRFYDLEIENFNKETVLAGLLNAVCKARTCSFEEVVHVVLMGNEPVDNVFLQEFEKYSLLSVFWKLYEQHFGYTDAKPGLEWLLVALFVAYTGRYVQIEPPAAWKSFISYKSGNITVLLDSLMNNVLYRDQYDVLSAHVVRELNALPAFVGMRADDLTECDTLLAVDQVFIRWLPDRLVSEDIGTVANGFTIPEFCEKRAKMHFGRKTGKVYRMLSAVCSMVKGVNYHTAESFKPIIDRYLATDYRIDRQYRKFYYYYDRLESTESFEPLRELVESIYANEYLASLLPVQNAGIRQDVAFSAIPLQREFYSTNLHYAKERTAVIPSDAMRYEVGQELFACTQDNPRCTAKPSVQLSVLPSHTRLGMVALLPYKTLEVTDDLQVLADGILCNNLAGRQQVLQNYNSDNVYVQLDDIKNLKVVEPWDVLTERQLIYVYHNQIDVRGDKANTEDKVFHACEEAIREIMDFIHRISVSGNVYHFIVTADYGFLYKHDKLTESDKISGKSAEKAFVNRRFIVSEVVLEDDGIDYMSMRCVLGNADGKIVSYPVSSNVFEVAGGGANLVYGGSSPQEMLVLVLEIKMECGHMEAKSTEIALVSIVREITNLITSLDFIQPDVVSDTAKTAKYRIFFLSEDNEKISNENSYMADSREENVKKRIFRMRFTFKNKKYDKDKQYYLVVYDEQSGLEQ